MEWVSQTKTRSPDSLRYSTSVGLLFVLKRRRFHRLRQRTDFHPVPVLNSWKPCLAFVRFITFRHTIQMKRLRPSNPGDNPCWGRSLDGSWLTRWSITNSRTKEFRSEILAILSPIRPIRPIRPTHSYMFYSFLRSILQDITQRNYY